jgi:hypothetical protein
MLDLLVQQLARQIADARLEVGDHSRREGPRDEGSELSVARGIKEDEPFRIGALRGEHAGAERLVIVQRALDGLVVEDHPQIELRDVQDGRMAPHLVVQREGIAAHLVREKVHTDAASMAGVCHIYFFRSWTISLS